MYIRCMNDSSNSLQKRYALISPFLDEKQRRLFLGAEASTLGYGGVSQVSKETGVSRQVIAQGMKELQEDPEIRNSGRIRKEGGGRKRRVDTDPSLQGDLEQMIDPLTRGDPESPLRWTSKSVRKLSEALNQSGHHTSHRMVAEMLHELGYSLQGNRKAKEGESHPDRDQQFEYINKLVTGYIREKQPVISVQNPQITFFNDVRGA
jgi:transposase